MNERFKEKKENKVQNIIQRIAEIDQKLLRLQSTKDQLYDDLRKNQELQATGPKDPEPKTIEVSEEQRRVILENSKAPKEARKMSAFGR